MTAVGGAVCWLLILLSPSEDAMEQSNECHAVPGCVWWLDSAYCMHFLS
jgi:hypothetical protein